MAGVFVVADHIYSPLGPSTEENFAQLKKGHSGIKKHIDPALSELPFYASLFEKKAIAHVHGDTYTRFENLLIASINEALNNSGIKVSDKRTLLIISTTKGNISLLETEEHSPALQNRVALHHSAQLVAGHFGFVNTPIVVCNACISGIMAILTGMRLILSGQYDQVVVAGADVISKFVLSGFQSFQAISPNPCRPFDINRDGITLGEAAATVILSAHPSHTENIRVLGGAVSNDANHISAPSRTGQELAHAINKTLARAGIAADDIGLISAHGTATIYNDEMEAKAITHANLQHASLNSLKGYYGHTLGAAGLVESIISMQSLKQGLIIPTLGFQEAGTTNKLNICTELKVGNFKNVLKIASGFGGCNAAIIFGRS